VRAQLSLFAIVVTLVAVLAVMPKSRGAGELADDSGDTTLAPTAKSASDNTDTTSSAANAASEIKVSSDEAEALIGAVYQTDDSKLWGNGVNWTQLKVEPVEPRAVFQGQIDHSFAPAVYCLSDLSAHPFGSAERDRMLAGKAYLDAARKLDDVANDLEEAKLFRDADHVREITCKLRTRARAFQSEPAQESPESQLQNFSFFLSEGR
jgi:hypothetical protein